jgi:hypothetical protein
VSQEFYRLCYDGQLWKTLDASEFYNRIPVDQLAKLIVSSGNFVRHLNLRSGVLGWWCWWLVILHLLTLGTRVRTPVGVSSCTETGE